MRVESSTSMSRLGRPGRLLRRAVLAVASVLVLVAAWLAIATAPASATATATRVVNPDAFTCNQPTFIGFEDFADQTNLSAQSFGGVDFTTTGGYTWRSFDFGTGYYNGKFPNGAYTSQGTHTAWLGIDQGAGQISFANRASTVSVLISAYTPIIMEAYNAAGNLLEATPYSRSNIRTGEMDLLKITRNRADIAYVILHDSGNYFLVDSLCTDAATTTPGTDLSITKSDAVDPIPVLDEETFTLQVTNNGPLDTDVADVTDSVPAGFSVTSASASQGSCPSTGNNVVCSLGALAVGDSATVTITATAGTAGTWTNTAQVGGEAADPVPGNNSASITTAVNGTPGCTITGTSGNDTIAGTAGDDVICGLAGNDTIRSSAGDDILIGGLGADTVSYAQDPGPISADLATATGSTGSGTQQYITIENVVGSPGADRIGGDDFKNTLDGGPGADSVAGKGGNDLVRGGADDDVVYGGPGSNGIDGGPGVDTVRYGTAMGPVLADLINGTATSTVTLNDTLVNNENLIGGPYDDQLGGDDGPNLLAGGQGGNDELGGKGGDDVEVGGSGDDLIFGGTGTNSLDGGPGVDTISYGSATVPVTASLVLQSGSGSNFSDELVGFENLFGGPLDDVLTGDSANNRLSGRAGDDLLSGKLGSDVVDGGPGVDRASFTGAPGPVFASLVTGKASGEGADTLLVIEGLIGGGSADRLIGNSGANTLVGGLSDDRLEGLDGKDTLSGEGGNDDLFGGAGNDTLSGGNGLDDLDGGPNFDVCSQDAGKGSIINCEG